MIIVVLRQHFLHCKGICNILAGLGSSVCLLVLVMCLQLCIGFSFHIPGVYTWLVHSGVWLVSGVGITAMLSPSILSWIVVLLVSCSPILN